MKYTQNPPDSPAERVPSPPAPEAMVIGAANMDLSGTPFRPLRGGDSNPGRITAFPGGVGRNIAENLVRLGRRTGLLSCFGEDFFGRMLRDDCRRLGLDLSLSITDSDASTSAYLCVNEADGDLHTAVSDMAVCDRMTPSVLAGRLPAVNRARIVILDANLREETLLWLAGQITVPIAADPVSAAKVTRLRGILSRLEILKPNAAEAELLTGIRICDEPSALKASAVLRDRGVRWVCLSLGASGVLADDGTRHALLPCFPGPVLNTTGCGDAFLAAVADGRLRGENVLEAAARGLAAAALCAASDRSVCPELSSGALETVLRAGRVPDSLCASAGAPVPFGSAP